ncbi:MAG: PKD domain-containing protein [Chitinophagaceae bacterium]
MNIKTTFGIGILSLLAYTSRSQNFELVENKGQWNPAVKFEGKLFNGAFFLEAQGYKVLQHNTEDLLNVTSSLHGTQGAAKPRVGETGMDSKITAPSNDALLLRSHAYEVLFDQSNPNPEIIPERPQPGYNNYFIGNDSKAWASNCKIYAAATYKNIYPGVDVRYYSDNGHLKYDILVSPKADISKLALRYDGVDGLQLRNGDLYIKTSVGEIKEQYPYSYQLVNGARSQVDCKFKITGNTVKFQLGNFDNTKTLVIDPTLVFASFTGSTVDNWGYAATYGPGGTMFGGGIAFGNGYPVGTGAFQGTFGGGTNTGESGSGYDIAIIKLSATGNQRVYATYVGGNQNEAPHSMVTDAQGNLIVAGRTTSLNFPVKSPVIGPGSAGTDWDIVIFKLNATGSALIGSLRIGGTSDDGVNIRNKYPNPQPASLMQNYGDDSRSEVIFDGSGNVLLASCSQSANFPVTAGAFQPVKSSLQDGLFLKFDANLSGMTYASFLGGSGDDAAYVLNASPQTGDIWVGGATSSTDFPGNKAGVINGTAIGNIDGFVAVVSPSGALLKSSYIGTTANDQVYGLKFDIYGFPYVMGTSNGNFPVQNAAFSQPGTHQFIAKLQKDLSSYVYSTVFGSTSFNSLYPNISPIAFLVDRCENVYISGWGGSITQSTNPQFPNAGTSGMTVTPDAIQSSTDGKDFYFFVLEKNAARQLYGSFYGQNGGATDHVDGGTSRFDDFGVIYQALCANCGGGANFPTTPGSWRTLNGSNGGCNEALVKIEFNLAGIKGGIKSSIDNVDADTSGCVPLTVDFRDTVALAKQYEWDFGDGTGTFKSISLNLSHTFTAVGVFRVRLIAIDSSKCFPRDTSFMNVRIRQDIAQVAATGSKLPPCQSTTYRFANNSAPYPGKSFTNKSFRWIWGDGTPDLITGLGLQDHPYPGIGTYNVKLVLEDTNFCNAPDTVRITIRISPNVKAIFSTPASGCVPYNAVFSNTSLGGTDFAWDFGDGTTGTAMNPTHLYTVPGTYTIKLVATDTSTCNLLDSTTFSIVVASIPTAGFTYSPNPAEENTITTFTNNSVGAVRFRWYYGDGDSLYTFRQDTTVRHQYNETKLYQPCLVALNQFGCPDTACQTLNSIVKPILDVPNAFTPNLDGVNDKAVVIGIGISRMVFRIYNRWGQLMFESSDRKIGWDGKFKGKNQPMDVYAYTLDAEFFDGKKVKKQGDITLLR